MKGSLTYRIADPETRIEKRTVEMTTEQGSFNRGEPGRASRKERIGIGPATIRNIAKGDRLRVYREDLDDFLPALRWRANNPEIDFALPVSSNGRVVEWQIPGLFEPKLTEKDIHKIVEDWRLLSPYFPQYKDVFSPSAVKLMLPMLEHVFQILRIMLESSTNLKMREKVAKEAPIPEWMKRALDLRAREGVSAK